MDWQSYFTAILNTLDITAGLNFKVISAIFLLTVLGEVNIAVPLLIEALWLMVGYQIDVNTSPLSVLNLLLTFIVAQAGRQIGISSVYFAFKAMNNPFSKLFLKRVQGNRFCQKYLAGDSPHGAKYFSLSSATIGMLTPLNCAIKLLLVLKRKLKILLIGTLLSGMAFDITYIVMGGVFHATTLNLAYMPIFMLIGFLVFIVFKMRVLK
jgi:hypothetical protein